MMSIPSLVRIAGNEVDGLEARQAILGELGDHVILHVIVGRFAHAKIPSVSSKPWFADDISTTCFNRGCCGNDLCAQRVSYIPHGIKGQKVFLFTRTT
jgi:hypothetical protein